MVLKGARRGEPLSAAGLDEILDGARGRAGLERATCHQLRRTLFHPAAGSGHGAGGHPGPGRSRLDRVEPASTCTWPTAGWRRSTCGRPGQSRRRPPCPPGRPAGERITGPAPGRRGPGRRLTAPTWWPPACSLVIRLPRRPACSSPGSGRGMGRLPLAAQCALPLKDRRVVGWLIVTGRLRPSADYLVACRPYLRRGRRPSSPGVLPALRRHLRRGSRLRPDRDPPAMVGPGQGDRCRRTGPRAGDPGRHRRRPAGTDRRHRPSPPRQSRPQGAQRGTVRIADHLVPPRRARRRSPQDQP